MRAILFVAMLTPSLAFASTWEIDPGHSSTNFTVRHLLVSKVHGQLGKVTGKIVTDDADPTKTTIDATIDVAEITTSNAGRDEELRSESFFDVKKFPNATFKSKKVEKAGAGKLKVTGDLTLHGVTKEVVLNVEGPVKAVALGAQSRSAATATTKLNRRDFGLNYSQMMEGTAIVSDEVDVVIDLELVKKDEGKKK